MGKRSPRAKNSIPSAAALLHSSFSPDGRRRSLVIARRALGRVVLVLERARRAGPSARLVPRPAPPLRAIGPRCRAGKARGGVGSVLESAPEMYTMRN